MKPSGCGWNQAPVAGSSVLMLMGNTFIIGMMGFRMFMGMIVFHVAVPVLMRMNYDLSRAPAFAAVLNADFPDPLALGAGCSFRHFRPPCILGKLAL